MRRAHARIAIAGLLAACLAGATLTSDTAALQSAPPSPAARWYKGNTHTHTLNQGGDSTPAEVVRWYREHGYQFVVITDHNMLTRVDGLNAIYAAEEKFLVMQGEEVTSSSGGRSVHVNGLDIQRMVTPHTDAPVQETLQKNIDNIRAASGVPHINHPNHTWGLSVDNLREARNYKLFEIYNGHPSVNNLGGGGVPGLEEAWDRLLSSGMLVYGIAVDDAHVFKEPGNPLVSGPGRAWVVVRSPRLEPRAILDAMERGDFYASTGVVLSDVQATPGSLSVSVTVESTSKYRIQFIGKGGRILQEATEPKATYSFVGDEGYVRAKVLESNGRAAWVQPVTVPRTSTTARLWRRMTGGEQQ
jgi:hypothetical protein